MSTGLASAMLC